jgi:hypothetical protein
MTKERVYFEDGSFSDSDDDKSSGVSPAALMAAMNGDLKNAMIASTPGGIERQEAEGQTSFVASETIPRDIQGLIYYNRYDIKDSDIKKLTKILEKHGFKFESIKPVEEIFMACALPEGWTKKATDHSMWSDLLDEKGRKRAGIFYKAAFYDRSAHMHFNQFYNISDEPLGGWEKHDSNKSAKWITCVRNGNGEILNKAVETREVGDYDSPIVAKEKCEKWLKKTYPKYEDVFEYWN